MEITIPHELLRCGLTLVELPFGVDVLSLDRRVGALVTSADAALVLTDAGDIVWEGTFSGSPAPGTQTASPGLSRVSAAALPSRH